MLGGILRSSPRMPAYLSPESDYDPVGRKHQGPEFWGPTVKGIILEPQPIVIDPHYSPQFYAELWGMSPSTVVRWFQDTDGVLKLSTPSNNGKRTRVELRIPYSLAMREYHSRTTQR